MQITITLDVTPNNIAAVNAFLLETVGQVKNLVTGAQTIEEPKKKAAPKAETKKAEEPKPEEPKAEETKSEELKPADPVKQITKTDLRAVALKISKAGKSDELAKVFNEFGAENLSSIKESDYPAVMERLVSINA